MNFNIERCNDCGKFINHGYVYAPWGESLDVEPPDDRFICEKCYTPEREKRLSSMWHPPVEFDWRKP